MHGECHGQGGIRIGHAWLEFDGGVYCPVLDVCLPIPVFERRLGAVVHARYTADEVRFLQLRFGHAGPW